MLRRSGLVSFRALCRLFALSVVLTLGLASSAFAQLSPTLSIDDVTVTEGDTGTTNANFTVTRSGDTSLISTVNFASADDTATQPGDYASVSDILTFNPGETTKTVTVSVNGDTVDETDEKFFVNLSVAVNATISDNQGTGTITDDDIPQANDDGSAANPITLAEDDPNGVTTDVLANDTGLDDTPITVGVTTPPGKGVATVNADKAITYKPNANQNGSDTYSYTVTDSENETSTAVVYLQITPVNDAPTISSVTNSGPVDEGSPAKITVSATDVEGDTLSYEFDCDNDSAAFEIGPQPTNNAQCTINDDGTHRVNVRVSDGNGGTATGFTNVTINNVAPNAVNDSASVLEDGSNAVIDVLANDTDVSGDTLTVGSFTQPANGTVTQKSDGKLEYKPNANFNGTDSFTYKATDGTADSNAATVTLTVDPVNDEPVAADDGKQVDEDDTLTFPAADLVTNDSTGPADESSQNLSVTAVGAALHGTAGLASGDITFEPDADYNGSASFEYTVCDDGSPQECGTGTLNVTVTAVNDAPVLDLNGNHSGVDYNATFTEDSGGAVGIVGASGPGGLTVADVDDTNMESATATLTNRPDGTAEALSMDTTGTTISATGYDSTTGVLSLSGSASKAQYEQVLRTVEYDNASETPSTADRIVEFVVNDGDLDSAKPNGTVAVISVNDTPVAGDQAVTTDEDNSKLVTLSATDEDNGSLSYMVTSLPVHGKLYRGAGTGAADEIKSADLPFTLSGGNQVTYEPNADYSGPDSFKFVANDGSVNSEEAAVSITVNPVNDAPSIGSVTNNGPVSEGALATVTVTASDVDGDTLSYKFDCDNDSAYEVGPQATNNAQCTINDDGTHRVNVRVSDGNGGTATDFTNVMVNAVDSAPWVTTALPEGKKVSPTANVTARFSEEIDAGTLSDAQLRSTTFVLKTSKGVQLLAKVQYNPATDTATLDPDAKLKRRATYWVTVTSGVEDVAGIALDQDQNPGNGNQSMTWSFRVRR